MTNKSITNKTLVKIGLMAIGNAGNNIVNNFKQSENINDIKIIYADISDNENTNINDQTKILLPRIDVNLNSMINSFEKFISIEVIEKIKSSIKDIDLLILLAGLGGPTGSNYLPLIARIAKEQGITTIAISNTPFSYEGLEKSKVAQEAIVKLNNVIDTSIIISSNRLMNNYPDLTAADSFKLINNIEKNCIKTFISLFSTNENFLINVSIDQIFSILKDKGQGYIGFGSGMGRNKINRALKSVLNSKIIDNDINNSHDVVLHIVGDATITINEINEIIDAFKNKIKNQEINVIFTYHSNPNLVNELQISLIATKIREDKTKIKSYENKLLHDSQEILIRLGNTLENELSSYATGELDLQNTNLDKINFEIDDKDRRNQVISSSETESDDDIPFFLK